jgi:hypothetical protein
MRRSTLVHSSGVRHPAMTAVPDKIISDIPWLRRLGNQAPAHDRTELPERAKASCSSDARNRKATAPGHEQPLPGSFHFLLCREPEGGYIGASVQE